MGAFVYVTNCDGSSSESKCLKHTRNRYNYNTPVDLIAKMTDLERGMQEEKSSTPLHKSDTFPRS